MPLALTVKVGKYVDVGGFLKVKVLHARGNQVSLLFIAPDNISITREELLDGTPNQDQSESRIGSSLTARIAARKVRRIGQHPPKADAET